MAIKIDSSMLMGIMPVRVSRDPIVEKQANRIVEHIVQTPIQASIVIDEPRSEVKPEPEDMTDDELYEELKELEEVPADFDESGEYPFNAPESLLPERLVDPTFPWDESQLEAIAGLCKVQHGCLIGAAGTGKTTCEKKVVDVLIHGDAGLGVEPMRMERVDLKRYHGKDLGRMDDREQEDSNRRSVPSILLCSYTGQATQNIKKNFPQSWHGNIMTIHSALGYYPETEEVIDPETQKLKTKMRFVPFYTKFIKMPWDVIVIDEASMANIDLWHQLLDASKPTTRFYFIGDINQLPPPVGQGILGFAMSRLPVFELRHIHRQKEAAANRIIETAWNILQGKEPELEDAKSNPEWRVIGMELPHSAAESQVKVVSLALALRDRTIKVIKETKDGLVEDPNYHIYDPWRDRILTCMNGYNPNDPASPIGQAPMNEMLAHLLSNKEERIIIDGGREVKKFCVGYRVMATKNEPPTVKDRVTNGMTGIITAIEVNEYYTGNKELFGRESLVAEARTRILDSMNQPPDVNDLMASDFKIDLNKKEDRIAGQSSHIITVSFNGIERRFATRQEVEQLQVAYASTVHKTQGSEMDTAIVIVHHAQKRMLCRESLYTAVTRATKRLIILYTPHGMRLALAKQKIFGSTIQEKVRQYIKMVTEEAEGIPGATTKVRLTQDEE